MENLREHAHIILDIRANILYGVRDSSKYIQGGKTSQSAAGTEALAAPTRMPLPLVV